MIVLALGLLILAWRGWPAVREMLEPPKPMIGQSASPLPSTEPFAEPTPDPFEPSWEEYRETPEWVREYLYSNQIETSTIPRAGMKLDELVNILGEPTRPSRVQKGSDGSDDREVKDPMGPFVYWYHNPKRLHVAPFILAKIENGVAVRLVASRH
jgi:hypothetical protein